MFIEFQVGNFRSFRDIQKFSMQAAPLRSNDGGLEEGNVFQIADVRLLKTKAIYGSNASGKTNVFNAFVAFSLMVNSSVIDESLAKKIWDDRFKLLTNWDDQPVFFQLTFLLDDTIYRYGFQILNEKIEYEWLFGRMETEETEYFMRSPEKLVVTENFSKNADIYEEQFQNGSNEIYRADALFLTAIALNANKLAGSIRNKIREILFANGSEDYNAFYRAVSKFEKASISERNSLTQLIKAADIGVTDIHLSDNKELPLNGKMTDQKLLMSSHSRYDDDGNLVDQVVVPFHQWESTGSKKLLIIGALVIESLSVGKTLIIDEFDSSFHPNLTLKIVELFQSEQTNPKNAQLIFITHDSGLLKRAALRRDQICFIDKNRYGISTLRTLIEYKGVRKDASYEKEYLQGSYAGIPFLNEMDSVIYQSLQND